MANRSLLAGTSYTLGLRPVSTRGARSARHPQRKAQVKRFAMHRSLRTQASSDSFDDMSFDSFDSFDSMDEDNSFDSDKPLTMVMVGGLVDYYQLLQVEPDADKKTIKKAYYGLTKECHPDIYGDDGHNMCILLNTAYETLSDENDRVVYDRKLMNARLDEEVGFTGEPVSKWCGPQDETRAVFVDECSCIGCKNCCWEAPATFRMEPVHGRSRVFAQWLNDEEALQTAIDSCPVDCIHWVDRQQLPLLEWVTKDLERVNVGVMSAGQGNVPDPFAAAASFAKKRAEELQKKQEDNLYGSPAQQAARRKAAEEIKKKATGFASRWGWPKVEKKDPTYSVSDERQMVMVPKGEDE